MYTPTLCTASMVTYGAVTDVTSKFALLGAYPYTEHLQTTERCSVRVAQVTGDHRAT